MQKHVFIDFPSADSLASKVASDVASLLTELFSTKPKVQLVVTGGTVGIMTLAALAPLVAEMDMSRLQVWFSDERFVERASSDRNAVQAKGALLNQLELQGASIHEFPAVEDGGIAEAAEAFALAELSTCPRFDLVLLGMGQDAHIASLFPGLNPVFVNDYLVYEQNSPKPPSERISLSFEALNQAERIWFLVAGKDKSEAIGQVFAGKNLPAGKVQGTKETRWYLDVEAASSI